MYLYLISFYVISNTENRIVVKQFNVKSDTYHYRALISWKMYIFLMHIFEK